MSMHNMFSWRNKKYQNFLLKKCIILRYDYTVLQREYQCSVKKEIKKIEVLSLPFYLYFLFPYSKTRNNIKFVAFYYLQAGLK